MKNRVTASVEFYFKGEKFTPSATINLDDLMKSGADLELIYRLIANANDIDTYSYHYEMMLAEPIHFDHADGIVADFISAGKLDLDAFKQVWNDQQIIETLQAIAARHLNIDDLNQHPDMKAALVEAWRSGERTSSTS